MFTAKKHRDSESSPYRQLQQHAQNIIKTGERMKAYAAQMDSIRSGSASASVSATGEAPGAKPDAENGSASVSATGEAPGAKADADNGSAKGGRQD